MIAIIDFFFHHFNESQFSIELSLKELPGFNSAHCDNFKTSTHEVHLSKI